MGGAIVSRWLLAPFAVLLALAASAAVIVGSPPSVRHTPDLDVFPQNFAIIQDSRGIVYVGNTNGVLEFDGERWALIALDNREIVRSLAVDSDDRVYVGGYNALGYLQRDTTGKARFVDLTSRFQGVLGEREFGDIWDTVIAPEGVYFRALRDLFFWDPRSDAVRYWHHEGRFGALIHHRGATLQQFRGEGFRRRDADEWTLLPETSALVDLIYEVLPLADGGLLTLGADGNWWRLGDGMVAQAEMPMQMPASSNFTEAIALPDGNLAFTAGDGLVYIVDPQRRVERHFKLDPGFLSSLYPAADGGFLVSGNQAIYRVDWPTPWSVLGAEHGIEGSLERFAQWNNVNYLLSSAGAFRVQAIPGSTPRFERASWNQTAYDLIEIDPARALLATAHKLMLVQGDALHELSKELVYPRQFRRSRFHPGRIYVGTEWGLRYVDVRGSELILSPPASAGLSTRISSIAEVSAHELWLGTERHGLLRVTLDAAGAIVAQKRYGEADGVALGVVPEAWVEHLADGALVVTTAQGIFRLAGERFVDDAFYGLAGLRRKEELLRVAQAPNGDQWAYGISRLLHRPADGQWTEQAVRQLRRGAYATHSFDAEGRAVFVTTHSLLLYDGGNMPVRRQRLPVLLRSVVQTFGDGSRIPLPLQPDEPVRLDYGDFGIHFQFALPDLTQEHGRLYQGRLVGYEAEFPDWSSVRGYGYSRLSPGRYALQVRARDSTGAVSQITPYTVLIEPPWYRRWWAYALWLAAVAAALWRATQAAIRRRTYRLADDKQRLEATVAERTRDLAAANQRLEMMANLDGLTGIANRRRLDEYLAVVWTQGRERRRPVAVLAIDVDHFKRYNDAHGHLAGDQLLKDMVARLMQCLRRAEDLLARYGGEEFLVVMPGADGVTAAGVAEEMRKAIDSADLGATISIGVASAIPDSTDVSELVNAADVALYAAKHSGRNRVVLSENRGAA